DHHRHRACQAGGRCGRYADPRHRRQQRDQGGRAPRWRRLGLHAARLCGEGFAGESVVSIVHFIGAGPGDPELITVRAKRLIETCPVVLYAGSLVPKEVVALARSDARVIDTAPLHLDEIMAEIEKAHAADEDVARVHSGDPSIYGAIAEQM